MDAIKKPENWCAIGMIGFFFLPWAQLFGANGSGYELSKFGSYGNWAWVIPITAVVTLVISLSGNSAKPLHIVTGLLPYAGVAYGLSQMGKDLFHVLAIGVYLTLLAGLFMVLFASGVLRINTAVTVGEATNRTATPGSDPPHPTAKQRNLASVIVIGVAVLAAIVYGSISYVQNQRELERVQAEKRAQEEYAQYVRREEQARIQRYQEQQQREQMQREQQMAAQREIEQLQNLFRIGSEALRRKQIDDAILPLRTSADRGYALAQNALAWLYATSSDTRYLDAANAVRLAGLAVQQDSNHSNIDTLAAAYARAGDFKQAVENQERAINLLREDFRIPDGDRARRLDDYKSRQRLYAGRQAYTEH